jgi:hypothetical protein
VHYVLISLSLARFIQIFEIKWKNERIISPEVGCCVSLFYFILFFWDIWLRVYINAIAMVLYDEVSERERERQARKAHRSRDDVVVMLIFSIITIETINANMWRNNENKKKMQLMFFFIMELNYLHLTHFLSEFSKLAF